jgi:prenyl protein peptidase
VDYLEYSTIKSSQQAPKKVQEHAALKFLRGIIIAPLTEELCFRSCMAPLLVSGGLSITATIFVCPVVFACAHLHHVYGHIKHGGYTAREAVQISLGQFVVTSLFGFYATFIFLRFQSIYGCFLAHAFCNFLGVPDFNGALQHKRKTIVCAAFVFGITGFATVIALLCVFEWPLLESFYWNLYWGL